MESPKTAARADDSCQRATMRAQEVFDVRSSAGVPKPRRIHFQSGSSWMEGLMTSVWALAALWLGLALIASLLSIWFRISTALSEIVVGTIAQLIIGAVVGAAVLGTNE